MVAGGRVETPPTPATQFLRPRGKLGQLASKYPVPPSGAPTKRDPGEPQRPVGVVLGVSGGVWGGAMGVSDVEREEGRRQKQSSSLRTSKRGLEFSPRHRTAACSLSQVGGGRSQDRFRARASKGQVATGVQIQTPPGQVQEAKRRKTSHLEGGEGTSHGRGGSTLSQPF